MCFRIRALVAPVIACAAIPCAGAAAHPRHHRRRVERPRDYIAWTRVAICESDGGWHVLGATYPDPLGISAANWSYFGARALGHPPAPQPYTGAAREEPMRLRVQAIKVAREIRRETRAPMPDQDGHCASW